VFPGAGGDGVEADQLERAQFLEVVGVLSAGVA
jgi:hypothetical protein